MANSRYEYVKRFELADELLPEVWIVIRLDGRGFTKFSQAHEFEKPNDERALKLMNASAKALMEDQPDCIFAYGVSDEYSFVLRKSTSLYQRRASKLVSVFVSYFASNFVHRWPDFFPDKKLLYLPAFDGRAVCYPTAAILRDYLAWRQVDCHINNQYNTCYWALVKSGTTPAEAQTTIKGTQADFKNELLFKSFGINYSTLPAIFRKGSCIYRKEVGKAPPPAQELHGDSRDGDGGVGLAAEDRGKVRRSVKETAEEEAVLRPEPEEGEHLPQEQHAKENGRGAHRRKRQLVVEHCDVIRPRFWIENPSLLGRDSEPTDEAMIKTQR